MTRAFSLLLINFSVPFTVVSIEQCHPDCYIFDWLSWGNCTGDCGNQKQNRKRFFCCSEAVQPFNFENCLQHCSLPNTFKTLQNQTCRVCGNGGTVLSASSPCICSSRYKGDCCEGRNILKKVEFR